MHPMWRLLFGQKRPDALETRLALLERAVEELLAEAADRQTAFDESLNKFATLYSRMSTRYQRLRALVTADPDATDAPPPPADDGPSQDVLAFRRSLGK